ncbi:cytochrome P450 [Bradyrhizobium sp.]|uniref:cytochrome P450 n=1 Tax=Bradyrhizobium sp. TaxID=376 RepID=UPI0039E53465
MTVSRPPVSDWKTDFDHLDPHWLEDPYPIWDDLRQMCPIAHTERYTGAYLPTKYDDIRTIAYDTENFTSARVSLRVERAVPAVPNPPLTLDPPHHRPSRMMILPLFTPQAIKAYEPQITELCDRLIDRFIDRGHCDGAVEYAQEITARMMARFFGVPEDMGPQFRTWIYENLELGLVEPDVYARSTREIDDYFLVEIAKRRREPTDDLIAYLMRAEFNGALMSDAEIAAALRLLMTAGIGTTWSTIGASIWHLATHPEDLARLVAEPELMPTAVEEFLRAYAPASLAREVLRDVEVGGCKLKAGQMVFMAFPAGNRDPAVFPDADKVILDRKDNKHMAFGIGIHRCLGSNLARIEIRIGLERLIARIPRFTLDREKDVVWSESHIRGVRKVPIVFGQQ